MPRTGLTTAPDQKEDSVASIFELEQQLKSPFGRGVAFPRGRKNTSVTARPALAPRGASPVVKASSRRVRAFAAVDFRVSGIVPPLRQETALTCWATVTTMLIGWRDNVSLPVEEALRPIGQAWADKYRAGVALLGSETASFFASAGLVGEPPASHTAEGWERLLRTYGPLWVTTSEIPGQPFSMHARVMIGIHGDGTASGTQFDIVDPGTGTEYRETLADFTHKYHAQPSVPNAPLILQVVHWPSSAVSQQKSITRPGYSRARNAGTVVAVGTLGYDIIKDAVLGQGDITFQTSKMDGIKAPNNDHSYDNRGSFVNKVITIESGLENIYTDRISAAFEIDFSYNGHCLAAVLMRNVRTNDAFGWKLNVLTDLVAEARTFRIGSREPVAGVKISFRFAFSRPVVNDEIYVEDVILYGTGDVSRNGRWTQ
jgi:Papain-like cysteine protease AvrRpt2